MYAPAFEHTDSPYIFSIILMVVNSDLGVGQAHHAYRLLRD